MCTEGHWMIGMQVWKILTLWEVTKSDFLGATGSQQQQLMKQSGGRCYQYVDYCEQHSMRLNI